MTSIVTSSMRASPRPDKTKLTPTAPGCAAARYRVNCFQPHSLVEPFGHVVAAERIDDHQAVDAAHDRGGNVHPAVNADELPGVHGDGGADDPDRRRFDHRRGIIGIVGAGGQAQPATARCGRPRRRGRPPCSRPCSRDGNDATRSASSRQAVRNRRREAGWARAAARRAGP